MCQALSRPRLPLLCGGQPGFCHPCVLSAVGAGVGTPHRPHSPGGFASYMHGFMSCLVSYLRYVSTVALFVTYLLSLCLLLIVSCLLRRYSALLGI